MQPFEMAWRCINNSVLLEPSCRNPLYLTANVDSIQAASSRTPIESKQCPQADVCASSLDDIPAPGLEAQHQNDPNSDDGSDEPLAAQLQHAEALLTSAPLQPCQNGIIFQAEHCCSHEVEREMVAL